MPIPTPTEGETQDEFMSRCMGDDTMNEEYPDQDQRAAVCGQAWRDRNKENSKMEKIIKIFDSFEVKESKDDRTLEFIGSKEITDRDREIVKVKGLDLKNYKKNPVVLWAHQYDKPAVAKTTRVWKSNDELKFKVKFAEMEEYSFADTVYKLYKGGYMNAVSIGFIPDYEAIEYPEKDKGTHRVFNKSELIELSLVPVGANPAALLQSKSIKKAIEDEVIDEVELDEMKMILSDLIDEEVETETEEEEEKRYCSECGKLIEKSKEDEDKILNKDEDNYIDELLSVLRDEKSQEKEQEEQEIDELIQILKGSIENNG